jgi:hypothetical protein
VLLVVGGQSRKVGKTSVMTGLIRATAQLRWTAVKIAGHPHFEEPCRGDTARFLEAGAARALLLGPSFAGMTALLETGENVICESNRVGGIVRPDCRLLVIDPSREEWKESARNLAASADALVVTGAGEPPAWLGSKPLFRVAPPEWISAVLVGFVLERLSRPASATETRSATASRRAG